MIDKSDFNDWLPLPSRGDIEKESLRDIKFTTSKRGSDDFSYP